METNMTGCSNCRIFPITGTPYKCKEASCKEYHLCPKCALSEKEYFTWDDEDKKEAKHDEKHLIAQSLIRVATEDQLEEAEKKGTNQWSTFASRNHYLPIYKTQVKTDLSERLELARGQPIVVRQLLSCKAPTSAAAMGVLSGPVGPTGKWNPLQAPALTQDDREAMRNFLVEMGHSVLWSTFALEQCSYHLLDAIKWIEDPAAMEILQNMEAENERIQQVRALALSGFPAERARDSLVANDWNLGNALGDLFTNTDVSEIEALISADRELSGEKEKAKAKSEYVILNKPEESLSNIALVKSDEEKQNLAAERNEDVMSVSYLDLTKLISVMTSSEHDLARLYARRILMSLTRRQADTSALADSPLLSPGTLPQMLRLVLFAGDEADIDLLQKSVETILAVELNAVAELLQSNPEASNKELAGVSRHMRELAVEVSSHVMGMLNRSTAEVDLPTRKNSKKKAAKKLTAEEKKAKDAEGVIGNIKSERDASNMIANPNPSVVAWLLYRFSEFLNKSLADKKHSAKAMEAASRMLFPPVLSNLLVQLVCRGGDGPWRVSLTRLLVYMTKQGEGGRLISSEQRDQILSLLFKLYSDAGGAASFASNKAQFSALFHSVVELCFYLMRDSGLSVDSDSILRESKEQAAKKEAARLHMEEAQRTGEALHPAHPAHPLKALGLTTSGWACDMAKTPAGCLRGLAAFHKSSQVPCFNCRACDFDICDLCYERGIAETTSVDVKMGTAPTAAKPPTGQGNKIIDRISENKGEWFKQLMLIFGVLEARSGPVKKELPEDFWLPIMTTVFESWPEEKKARMERKVLAQETKEKKEGKSEKEGKEGDAKKSNPTEDHMAGWEYTDTADQYRSLMAPFLESSVADEELVDLLRLLSEGPGGTSRKVVPALLSPSNDQLKHYRALENLSLRQMRIRAMILISLNETVAALLGFVDLSVPLGYSMLTDALRSCRGLIMWKSKQSVWTAALSATTHSGGAGGINLNRFKTFALRHANKMDSKYQHCTFSQAARQLRSRPEVFRLSRNARCYSVTFAGEYSTDAGGPYRESLDGYCDEIMSDTLPLFIPCANNKNQVGQNQDKWIPRPNSTRPRDLQMYHFVGMLMGMAMRTGNVLPLSFASIVWKHIVGQEITDTDVTGHDLLAFKIVVQLQSLSGDNSLAEDIFNEYVDYDWVVYGADQKPYELCPGGAGKRVTWNNRHAFMKALRTHHLSEGKVQCEAIRQGLACVVPLSVLSLFTWQELEVEVCGVPEIDVDMLEAHTNYNGCSASDPHIRLFWTMMRTRFSNAERAKFLKFVWGRTRLPIHGERWDSNFSIAGHSKASNAGPNRVNNYLPDAHTCFFTLDLPKYTTLEVMHEKILFAITHCVAVDGDSSLNSGVTSMEIENE